MRAKTYLRQLEKLERMIDNKREEQAQVMLLATGTTSGAAPETGVRVQSSGSQQRMADAVCMYIDMGAQIKRTINKLLEMRQEIIGVIEQLDSDEYDVLHKRYVGVVAKDRASGRTRIIRMELQEIADAYGRSYSWARGVHGDALKKVQRIIDARNVVPYDEMLRAWMKDKV